MVEKFSSHLLYMQLFLSLCLEWTIFLGARDVKVVTDRVSAVYVTELRLYLHSMKWFLVSYIEQSYRQLALMIKWLAGVN